MAHIIEKYLPREKLERFLFLEALYTFLTSPETDQSPLDKLKTLEKKFDEQLKDSAQGYTIFSALWHAHNGNESFNLRKQMRYVQKHYKKYGPLFEKIMKNSVEKELALQYLEGELFEPS